MMAALVPTGISLLFTFSSCHSIYPPSPHMRTDIVAIVAHRTLTFDQLQLKCLHSSFTPDCVHMHTRTHVRVEN